MIECDYQLVRDEEDETKTFIPQKQLKRLDNITYIEAPNSFGKSTLLNILALSMYGLDTGKRTKHINPALLKKMESLVDANHQKLTFTVTISNQDGSVKLRSRKTKANSPQIVVEEIIKGKKPQKLSPELFDRKYNLIYDIPDNPTERLSQLAHEIKESQINYGYKAGILKEAIRRIINEISNARDPNRIKSLKANLTRQKTENEVVSKTVIKLENELTLLEDFVYSKMFSTYTEKCKQIGVKIDRLQKSSRRQERQSRTEKSEHYNLNLIAQELIKDMQTTFDKASDLLEILIPPPKKNLLKVWSRVDFNEAFSELEIDDTVEEQILAFKAILEWIRNEKDKEESTREAGFYRDFLSLLEDYQSLKGNIAAFGKTIRQLMNEIEAEVNKHESTLNLLKNAEEAIRLLDELRDFILKANRIIFPQLQKLKTKMSSETGSLLYEESITDQILKLKDDLGDLKEKLGYYEQKYAAKGRPSLETATRNLSKELHKYEGYTEDQLTQAIIQLSDKITEDKSSERKAQHSIQMLSAEIDRLEKKEPHKYQQHLKKLETFFEKLQYLESKLKNEYQDYIRQIINPKEFSSNPVKTQLEYNDAVFKYLGKRLGKIPYLDKKYTVEYIDLIKGIVKTKEKKTIRLTDMGTGQSQSAYLKGRLNTSDKRPIIALFDEVAMMDNQSLEPIYNTFQELYDKDRLLVGIVVQKGESPLVISKIKK